jgi:hypothetical protein
MTVNVTDVDKAIIPDSTVTITGPLGTIVQTTNAQGATTFVALVPGAYTAKIEKQGFKAVILSSIQVVINNTATVNVALEVGSVSTTIEVTGTAQTVDPTQSSINANLTQDFLSSVPIPRNVSSVMMLAPGVVTGLGTSGGIMNLGTVQGSASSDANPSIEGASGLENLYVADGVVLNDPSYGGFGNYSTVYGALGVGITPAFIQEEEVKTAGFEPKYGHATGGVVQLVTKSGSNKWHGQVGGYFQSRGMGALNSNADDFGPVNLIGRHLENGAYEGDAELGGYVPGFKNHLFFFGAFDPTFFNDYEAPALGSGLYTLTNGEVNRRTNDYAYAGKLTARINDNFSVESSVFGDPGHTNHAPFSTLNADNTSVYSKWDLGTRSWDTRLYATITPTWTFDFAYTYGWGHFTETPADTTIYPILDQTQIGECVSDGMGGCAIPITNPAAQRGEFQGQGLGTGIIVNYQDHAQSLTFDTSKTFRFGGQHVFSVGYFWQYPVYNDITSYSTPRYLIPTTNATGGDPGTSGVPAGATSDASLELQIAPASCTLCPLMNVPGFSVPVPVTLYQIRGRFDNGVSHNTGKYNAAYVNDSWQMGQYVTLNVGLRWEQQRLTGTAAHAFFNDQWSPRVGFIVAPTNNSKIYVDFDRMAFVLPLDMAVRELSSEDDNLNEYWAPDSVGGMVTFNQYGTVNFDPTASHLLNLAAGGIDVPASIEIQAGGEPFTPGIRMEYNDEWVVGGEHKFAGGFFGRARYIDRRMKRVVEDEVGQSVEQLTALAFNGGSYSYVIGNPNAQQAIFVTPNEITWTPTPVQVAAYNAAAAAGTSGAALYETLGPPSGCFDSASNLTPFNSGPMYNTFGALQGAACFPAVNGVLNTDPTALFGGEYFPHGCPYCKAGLYPNPERNYQAVEFDLNKSFSNNWLLLSNFRIGRLQGNYEGAFRNDNDQSDPGISSLFDLTNGDLGLLGQQLGIGPLNTNRKYVFHALPSYTLATSFAKNLQLGAGVNVQSGLPVTTLAAQQIYGNPGEVPLYGRGNLGTTPVTGTIDAHVAYPIKFGERKTLKFEFDAFNIANTRRYFRTTQDVDLSFGIPNGNFADKIPLSFIPAFNARGAVLFSF